jgi:hypothetical protein
MQAHHVTQHYNPWFREAVAAVVLLCCGATVLCCAVLCCAVLCCAVLCCAVLLLLLLRRRGGSAGGGDLWLLSCSPRRWRRHLEHKLTLSPDRPVLLLAVAPLKKEFTEPAPSADCAPAAAAAKVVAAVWAGVMAGGGTPCAGGVQQHVGVQVRGGQPYTAPWLECAALNSGRMVCHAAMTPGTLGKPHHLPVTRVDKSQLDATPTWVG